MGKIFNKKTKEPSAIPAQAPIEEETPEEIAYTEKLSDSKEEVNEPEIQAREIPVCLSQTQINNMVIDNNMLLKYIISKIEEE